MNVKDGLARCAPWMLLMLMLSAGRAGAQEGLRLLDRAGLGESATHELLRRAAPGGVVALVQNERIEVEALGHLGTGRTVAMREDRLFGTGDLAQLVAALVAARLAARGAVALDGPIREWAPDLPTRVGGLTLEQLLTNTSGLDDARDEPPRRGAGPAVWPGATDRALFTEPGALYSPSRHGPRLARELLVRAAGAASFDALAREVLFGTIGLERSTFDATRADALGAAPGQVVSNTADAPLYALLPRASPVEQLYTTAGDIALLLRAGMTDGSPLHGAFAWAGKARAVVPAEPADSIGAGVRITRFAGRRMVSYEGGIAGYGTVVRWLPDVRAGVVVLANATRATLTETADGLLRHALGVGGAPAAPAATDVPAAPVADSAYAGTWGNGDRIIVLELDGGRLHWVDGDLRLPVRRDGRRLDVLVADGRIAQTLLWYADGAGRTYLLAGDLAYLRQVVRGR